MFVIRAITKTRSQRQFFKMFQPLRLMSNDKSKLSETKVDQKIDTPKLGGVASKYQIFKEEDSEVILDIYEDSKYGDLLEPERPESDPFEGLNLEHGVEGVYDIEDLVEILRRENAKDIFVATVPKEIKYVNYICVVTGKSQKHMKAIAQFVRTIYKKKMYNNEQIPKIEGDNSKDWMALDLGNIALHVFSPEARILYDLDCLWSVGPQYDPEYNKEDPVVTMLEKQSQYLQDLHPA